MQAAPSCSEKTTTHGLTLTGETIPCTVPDGNGTHADGRLGRVVAAIHDVTPRFEREVEQLVELTSRHLGTGRVAMLVIPDHWGQAPLAGNPVFRRRLRDWAEQGVEMFVHGWYHRDDSVHGGLAGLKARHFTASEGEFLGLARAEASRRMAEGRALIEDCTGRKVAGFIAPAWLYSEDAYQALSDNRFALAEDHLKVWSPVTGRVVSRGPVITWATRSRSRAASSIAWAAGARALLARCDTVRLAVHPGDTTNRRVMASIEKTFSHFASRRRAARYADLLADACNGFPRHALFT